MRYKNWRDGNKNQINKTSVQARIERRYSAQAVVHSTTVPGQCLKLPWKGTLYICHVGQKVALIYVILCGRRLESHVASHHVKCYEWLVESCQPIDCKVLHYNSSSATASTKFKPKSMICLYFGNGLLLVKPLHTTAEAICQRWLANKCCFFYNFFFHVWAMIQCSVEWCRPRMVAFRQNFGKY